MERSPLENVILNHLPHVLGCKVLVCAVIRDGYALIPSGDTMLRRGDHIYVTAPVTVLSYLMKRLGITQKKIRHAMLIGGGRVSYLPRANAHRRGRPCQDHRKQSPAQ